jgi:hypothetical protein
MTSEVYVPASTKCIEVVDSYFYNDIHIDLKSNYILNGYWSEEYFIEIEDIRKSYLLAMRY